MTELSFEYRWALSRRRTFLWSLFFSSSLVLLVYFSHRFIQAVSASFQNRFSTWLDLCSTSAPTHKTLPLSPEAQLTWHDNALAAHSFRQEKQMREICPSFSTTPGLKPPRSLWMLWPALYLALPFASCLPKPSELLLKRDAVEIDNVMHSCWIKAMFVLFKY